MLTLDEILEKADEITLELQENSITPPRIGELLTSMTEQLRLLSAGGTLIGASKLSELSDVMLLNEKENDILQRIGTKWTNVAMTNYATLSYTNTELAKKVDKTVLDDMFVKVNIGTAELPVWAIKTTYDFFSEKEISAYGAGTGVDGGATGYDRLDAWSAYTVEKSGWVLSAFLGNNLNDRVSALEAGGTGSGSDVVWGTPAGGHVSLTVDSVMNILALATHEHTISQISDFPASMPASDVSEWAKAASKPSYSWNEISSKPNVFAPDTHDHYISDILNFPTSMPASDVYSWAKEATKPSYIASEIGGLGASYRWLTDTYIATWNAKANGTHTHYKSDIVDFVHSHSTSDITSGTFAIARIPTGTTGATVALGNHLHTGVYEPVLGNPSANGYLLSSTTAGVRSWVAPYSLPIASASVIGGVKIGANVSIASGVISVHNPVTIGTANGLSLSTQVLSLSLATTAANGALSATDKTYIELLKTFFEYDSTNNAIKALKSFYSTGEVSAYGLGSTGGGGGVGSLVIWGTESAGAVPLTVEGVTKTLSLASHTHTFESITSKPTTLSGYGITDALLASDVYAWAKAATKPYYVWSEIGSKPTTFAPSAHTHYKSDILDFAHTHNLSEIGITGLTANYLTKYNGSTLVNSSIFDNGTNVGIGTAVPTEKVEILGSAFINNGSLYIGSKLSRMSTNLTTGSYDFNYNTGATGQLAFYGGGTTSVWNVDALGNGYFSGNVGIGTTDPTAKLDVNGIGKFKDDILMTFNTWTHATDKNSLNKFLKLFDIDAAGNLVVKTNLYSTGEVTAYSSGTGVSGLKLMADMNANGKNINNVLIINAQQVNSSKISAGALQIGNNPTGDFPNCVGLFGYRDDEVATYSNLIATYNENTGEYIYANNLFVVDSAGQATATSFKFGNWTIKQDGSGRIGFYNGISQKAYIAQDGTYVKL